MIEFWFGILAAVGIMVWIVSLIVPLLHDIHRIWSRLVNGGGNTRAKLTVEEMHDTTPYAASRNVRQAMTRKSKP